MPQYGIESLQQQANIAEAQRQAWAVAAGREYQDGLSSQRGIYVPSGYRSGRPMLPEDLGLTKPTYSFWLGADG